MFKRPLKKMLGDGNLECPAFGGTRLKLFVFSHKTASCGQKALSQAKGAGENAFHRSNSREKERYCDKGRGNKQVSSLGS